MPDNKVRLQKFLSEAGVASRRHAEVMISAGEVKVNGVKASLGDSVDPKRDVVTVKGKKILVESNMRYILLHKPRGFVTTTDDEKGRKCVTDLVSDVKERVYPVGRLDMGSEGALLMTNDGELANAMTHPSHHVPKTYRVTVRPPVSKEQVETLSSGVDLDGVMTAPADVRVITREENRVVLEIVLYEGKNRQIRRMCEKLGIEIARLKRTAVGPIKLGMLPQGRWRDLDENEINKLFKAAGLKRQEGRK